MRTFELPVISYQSFREIEYKNLPATRYHYQLPVLCEIGPRGGDRY